MEESCNGDTALTLIWKITFYTKYRTYILSSFNVVIRGVSTKIRH